MTTNHKTWSFHAPGELIFGRGSARKLGEITTRLGAGRVLIVTDPALVEAGVLKQVHQPLADAGKDVAVFDGGAPEPPMEAVEDAVKLANEFKPDVLLGLGGGSNMDIAKATAAVLVHGGTAKDYAGDGLIPGPVFPLILMPTTAGTGSEVTFAAVLADTKQGVKFGILSNYLRPKVAVVDPLLTLSCPPKVTAISGIDALTHAIEAYTAIDNEDFQLPEGESSVYQGQHPIATSLAERAIQSIGQSLSRAVNDGSNVKAREDMAMGATIAGLAFANIGVAIAHALEYGIGQTVHTPHGLGCGLMLPYVMRFNAPARLPQMARIAALLGEEIAGIDDEAAAMKAIGFVEKLRADIGIPARMSEVGIKQDHLRKMAETSFGFKRILRVNPRPVTQQDLESILSEAL